MSAQPVIELPEPLDLKLTKDIKTAAKRMDIAEARLMVRWYYDWQRQRIRVANQVVAASRNEKPNDCISYVADASETIEHRMLGMLKQYADATELGRWAQSHWGIGPVLACALLTNVNIVRCPWPGNLHSFAGLDPSKKWTKGMTRPWNAFLKTACWKMGESFIKGCRAQTFGKRRSFYGLMYILQKAHYQKLNERGNYAERCKAILAGANYGKETQARKHYESGHLPPAHISAMARRWAVKLWLTHYWQQAWETENPGQSAPNAWILTKDPHSKEVTREHVASWESGEMTDDLLYKCLPTHLAALSIRAVLEKKPTAEEIEAENEQETEE